MSDFTALEAAGSTEQIAELAHRAANTEAPEPYVLGGDTSIIVRTVRNDENIRTIDLEKLLVEPRRARGTATITDPADFISYVNRLRDDRTTVWADEKTRRITAVFNDHADAADGSAGWRDHTASLAMQIDPDWTEWMDVDGKLGSQEWFANFLEDHARTIVSPDAATMFEVARGFQARTNSAFSRAIRVDNGDVQLTWTEETEAKVNSATKGTLEVPQLFTVRLAPFVGVPASEVTARLRWRLRDGTLGIGFSLLRPDLVMREAFQDVLSTIRDAVDSTPVLLGSAPQPLAAQ